MLYHSVCLTCSDELVGRNERTTRTHHAAHSRAGHDARFAVYDDTEPEHEEARATSRPERELVR